MKRYILGLAGASALALGLQAGAAAAQERLDPRGEARR